VLANQSRTGVRVLVVWEPILITDIAPPISAVLGRMSDPRVRQFWDADHLLSEQMKQDARAPQPVQECCERRGHLWDMAAVYPSGSTWTQRLPVAEFFNGPVLDVIDPLTAALTSPNR
jgi:hypothetical protein